MADETETTETETGTETETTETAAETSETEQKFEAITTQGEFEQRLGRRLRQERDKFSDYDDLKKKAAKLDEIEAAGQTDLEKATARIADLELQAADATTAAQESRLRAAVVAEAAKRNVIDPDAALVLLDRTTLELDDDGKPANIAEAMDALLKERPYLVAGQEGRSGNGADQGARGSGGTRQITESELKTMTPEQIDKAHREGLLNNLLGVKS